MGSGTAFPPLQLLELQLPLLADVKHDTMTNSTPVARCVFPINVITIFTRTHTYNKTLGQMGRLCYPLRKTKLLINTRAWVRLRLIVSSKY